MIPFKSRLVPGSRWVLLTAMILASFGASGFFQHAPSTLQSLAENSDSRSELLKNWRNGDVIVLVRHAERCDRSDAPCLSSADGITVRARSVASDLGHSFDAMGLANTDIASSPLLRARQTAEGMFGSTPAEEEWLFHCRGAMLARALRYKQPHRNLILVTHSECIRDLESAMSNPYPAIADYASSVFVIDNGREAPSLLGYLDADQWHAVVSTR